MAKIIPLQASENRGIVGTERIGNGFISQSGSVREFVKNPFSESPEVTSAPSFEVSPNQ